MLKYILLAGLALGLAPGAAMAQTGTAPQASDPQAPGTRNPELGDAMPQTPKRPTRRARAAALARGDKQPAGTQNGNQPDRAMAGGGAR